MRDIVMRSKVLVEALLRGKGFLALGTLERFRFPVVQVDLSYMSHHVPVPCK